MSNSAVFIVLILISLFFIIMIYRHRLPGRLIRAKINIWTNLISINFVIMMLKLKRLF